MIVYKSKVWHQIQIMYEFKLCKSENYMKVILTGDSEILVSHDNPRNNCASTEQDRHYSKSKHSKKKFCIMF